MVLLGIPERGKNGGCAASAVVKRKNVAMKVCEIFDDERAARAEAKLAILHKFFIAKVSPCRQGAFM